MELLKRFLLPIISLVALVAVAAIGFASGQAGWIALAFLCVWPFLWAVAAWTLRGLRETYQLVPKAPRSQRQARVEGQVLG